MSHEDTLQRAADTISENDQKKTVAISRTHTGIKKGKEKST